MNSDSCPLEPLGGRQRPCPPSLSTRFRLAGDHVWLAAGGWNGWWPHSGPTTSSTPISKSLLHVAWLKRIWQQGSSFVSVHAGERDFPLFHACWEQVTFCGCKRGNWAPWWGQTGMKLTFLRCTYNKTSEPSLWIYTVPSAWSGRWLSKQWPVARDETISDEAGRDVRWFFWTFRSSCPWNSGVSPGTV